MKTNRIAAVTRNDRGSALMLVIVVGSLIGIMAYLIAQLMTNADHENMRLIRRNLNITYSILLSDQINDKQVVKNLGTIPQKINGGTPVQYQ